MAETDTKTLPVFIAQAAAPSSYESYKRAIRNFSYAAITHHDRYALFEAALAKAGVAKWTLYDVLEAADSDAAKRIFLEYFDGEFTTLFPNKPEQELNSTVPKEVIDTYMPRINEFHKEQILDRRAFSRELTSNFIAQLRRQNIPLPTDLENRVQSRVEGVIPDIIRTSTTLTEVEGKVKNYLIGALATIAETQPIVASQQTTLEQASQESVSASRPIVIDLMARPQVLTRTIAAPVLDKQSFETILTKLITQAPSISISRHAQTAQMLTRTLEATNATVVGADAARAGGQLLIVLAQQSNKPLGIAVAAILNPLTRDRIFEAIAAQSWEKAVDNVTKKAATLALDQNILQKIIENGNQSFGVSTGKGGAVAARGFVEAIWGNIAGPMENHIISQHDLSRLGMPLPQRQFTSIELFMAVSYAYAQGPPMVVMHGEGQKEGGGFLRFILSWGVEEGAAKLIKKGAVKVAGGTVKEVVKKGVTSFVTGLLTRIGLTALASTVAPVVGTVIAVAVQAAVWLGGFIVRPLWNLATKFFRGELGPWGPWTQAFGSYVRDALGAAGQTAKNWWDNPAILLPAVMIVAIIIPVVPILNGILSPTLQDTTRLAAMLTSFEAAIRTEAPPGYLYEYTGPFPGGVADIIGCPVNNGGIFQGPFEQKSHRGLDAYDFTSSWGSPVFATHDGLIARAIDSYPPNFSCPAGQPCSFGNFVQIAGNGSGGNYTTIYAHLLTVTVSDGQTVQAGDVIGYVDATGYTFRADGSLGGGTHLHYQYNGPGQLQPPAGCGT